MQRAVLLIVALVTLFMVGFPLVWLALGGFGIPDAPSLDAFTTVFSSRANRQALFNTVILALGTGLLAMAFGVPLAWLTARTDMRGKGAIGAGVALAYMIPPYLSALSYIVLAAPRSGYVNRWLGGLVHADHGPFNIFSMTGVIFVISLHTFPFVYFLTYSALRSIDGGLEQSAQLLGSSRGRIFRTVTLPLIAPAVTAGTLLAATASMALFGPQAFLGIPGHVDFLPTRLYAQLQTFPPRFPDASALASMLVLLTVGALFVQRLSLQGKSYVTVAGKATQNAPFALGRWSIPALIFSWTVLLLSVILPMGILALLSLSKDWIASMSPANWTLANYAFALFQEPTAQHGIFNSLRLATAAATIAIVFALFIAYIDLRTKMRGRRFLDYLTVIPLGLPGIVLALGLLEGWIRIPLPIYGTIWILLIAYVVRFLPLAVRSANSSLLQIDPSLEEVGRITGASWLRVVRTVSVPLLRPGLLIGWILVFVPAFADLSATILLYSPGNETIAVAIYRLNSLGRLEIVAALSMVGFAVTAAVLLIVTRLAGRSLAEAVSV